MRLFNSFIKGLALIFIHLCVLLQTYILSLLITGALLSLFMSVGSIFSFIPAVMVEKFWLVLIVASIPLCFVFFLIVELDLLDRFTDYRYKARKRKAEKLKRKSV